MSGNLVHKEARVGRPKSHLLKDHAAIEMILREELIQAFRKLEPETDEVKRSDTLATAVIRIIYRIPFKLAGDRRIIPRRLYKSNYLVDYRQALTIVCDHLANIMK